jgi:TRAP-type uncharacterized transport system substrate-binding protein
MVEIPDGSIKLANSNLEPLPRGANFIRAKALWEIGLDVAGDPSIPYGGDRDLRISVGSGGGAKWKPALNLATGSAVLAHDVCAGAIDVAFVNPSALLTQAYRGSGLFAAPLPVRVIASYPSWDSFAMVVHPRTKLSCVADIRERQYPLRISVREDPTHSTLVLIDQLFSLDGFKLADVLSWGGELVTTGSPFGPNRMNRLVDETIDAVFDEALVAWFDFALKRGYQVLEFSDGTIETMTEMGWRKVTLKAGDYSELSRDYHCLDFSGWPLYCREGLDEKRVVDVCRAIVARKEQIPWTAGDYTGVRQVFGKSRETPLDVPFHPGVERFLRDYGGSL